MAMSTDDYRIVSNEDIKFQRWKASAELLFANVSIDYLKPFSIRVVPEELRKWNENAYIPKVISIGPRYKGATRDLQQMEEIKWDFTNHLFHRSTRLAPSFILHKCLEPLLILDTAVRASYADEINLDRYELGTIMLNDGCFLLELLIMNGSKELNEKLKNSGVDQSSKDRVVRLEEGLTDLILMENQIPLIILKRLAGEVFHEIFKFSEVADYPIGKLVRSFLGLPLDSSFDPYLDNHAAHFLELVYVSIFENMQVLKNVAVTINEEPHDVGVKLNRCATKLQAAGVIIKSKTTYLDNKPSDVDIKFNPITGFNFDIEFNNGKLEIPRLHITERAEARWCNFIAWEHYKMKERGFINKLDPKKPFSTYKCKCTWAALFFNGLICCASDVKLLKDKEIIVDHSNMSNQDLVDLLSSIPKGVDPSIIDSNYVKMFYVLNTYSKAAYAVRIPIILWHYLTRIPEMIYNTHRFLRKGYNFAAAIISLLTVIQTVYTILSYYDPKN